MAEALGLALAIVSIFDTCVTACRLISTAGQFPHDMEYLHVSISWEESRLKTWARVWEIETLGTITAPQRDTDESRAVLLVAEAGTAFLDLELLRMLLLNAESLLRRGKNLASTYEPHRSRDDAVSPASTEPGVGA